jgi:3-oxoacyl-[acyl-carrier protein] reductase
VTGAAGSIGGATVHQLLENGSEVIASDLPGGRLDALKDLDGVTALPCDFTDSSATQLFAQEISDEFTAIGGFVHVAGNGPSAPVERMSDKDWDAALDVHLNAAFRICRAIVPRMEVGGGIVLISSTSIYGARFMAGYAAAKIAMVGLARTLAIELGPRGIRANVVAPGPIDTPLLRTGPEDWVEKLPSRVPLERLGQPSEIADVSAFLLSDKSTFLTGQCIVVDGGFCLGG